MKIKTYVLMIAEKFPANHPKAGRLTDFGNKILSNKKIHTIRGNYELWEKRFKEIHALKAVLSIRIWEGKPYASKQIEILSLDSFDGIGIEKIEFNEQVYCRLIDNKPYYDMFKIAESDGLTYEDFKQWFSKYNLSKPLAIIHFTSFRYNNQ